MAKRAKAAKPGAPEYPVVIETYFPPTSQWERAKFEEWGPSCFNGCVRVERYRITVELIDEPLDVIHARLIKLWEESDNMHHCQPLKNRAAKYGLELPMESYGKRRKKSS